MTVSIIILSSASKRGGDEAIHDALNVALVVGGSIVIPHLRHAFETLELIRQQK